MKQCPQCGKTYEPVYETKQQAKNKNDKIAIEQHMTGICSRECYMKYIGSYVSDTAEIKNKFNSYIDTLYITIENVQPDNTIEKIVDSRPIQCADDGSLDHDIQQLEMKIQQNICFVEM